MRLTWVAVGPDLDSIDAWRLHARLGVVPAATIERRAGCVAVTLPATLQRDTPEFKSTSYLSASLGLRHARRMGANEGLFVGGDGRYLEGTSCAIVAWDDGRLVRPAGGALPSVTAHAFERHLGVESERRDLTRADLLGGAVALGALTLAVPLLSIDGDDCRRPAAMDEAIRAFNHHLVASDDGLGRRSIHPDDPTPRSERTTHRPDAPKRNP